MSPRFGFTILGSGSGGNSSVVHGPDGNLLLDEGFSGKELLRRLNSVGVNPASIRAILITHAHNDHMNKCGCAFLARKLNIPVYLVQGTIEELRERNINIPKKTELFRHDDEFDLCGIHVETFAVSHDVTAVGFAFSALGHKIGYATDLGFASDRVKEVLSGCDLLVLESNYDTKMLRMSARRLDLKRRIESTHGHLGNTQTMNALGELLSDNTKHLILAHISRDCNDPELLAERTRGKLAELNRQDVSFCLASQSDPLDTICLDE
jgi:phosphoribosyl 1,2-cyclic phosphodiesterase